MADYPDFEGDKSGVYLRAGWASYEGDDKGFTASGDNKARGATVSTSYVVPTGKTLYITHATFAIYATNAADSDANQIGQMLITDTVFSVIHCLMGQNGGGFASFDRPIRYDAGDIPMFVVYNRANHNCDLDLSVGGYEL